MNRSPEARQALISRLRREVAQLESDRPPDDDRPLSTGSPALDSLLPAGGLKRGTLVEYLSSAAGSGAGILALAAAREACREGRALVVLDGQRQFYPPAAAAWGIDLAGMILLRPKNEADALWALDQALRCTGVGAVWTTWDRLDSRDFRRLQLAAESGRTLGIFVRPASRRGEPTWAEVQWVVKPEAGKKSRIQNAEFRMSKHNSAFCVLNSEFPWRLWVELARCRGVAGGQTVLLELDEATAIWREAADHATHTLPASTRVARSASARGA
jgi:hypothetical protein